MPIRKNRVTRPGQEVFTNRDRASKLIATGRNLPPNSAMTEMANKLPKHWWQTPGFKKWRKRTILTIITLIIVSTAYFGYKFWSDIDKLFGNPFGLFSTQKLNGEDSGHVNILLAGYSADDPGHNGADLTDSIMLVSINTNNHTAFMLSVPRDLWVNIPGFGYAKINSAYQDGDLAPDGTTEAGMNLLSQVISQKFGLPIDYYALINYQAIKDAVNAVGGININIDSCDPRGLYDPNIDYATGGPLVNLTNGTHHLNGEQALDLARARGDPSPHGIAYGFCDSDFTRTKYQREMLLALKSKATSGATLANPFKITNLLDAVGNNVKTNFTAPEVHRLYDIAKLINGNDIKSYGLNDANSQNLLTSYTTYMGQSALIPQAGMNDYSQIQQFVASLMNPPATATNN